MSQSFSTAVIGAGAAGIVAAISSRRANRDVVLLEKMPQIGKKILASGNGRCNLLNENLEAANYNPTARPLVRSIFSKFGKDEIKAFFKSLGLELYYEDGGRVFPATNQAASVLKCLELELKGLSIPIELNFKVENIFSSGEGFVINSKSGKKISSKNLIVTGGGKSYPALGSDGSCYKLAEGLGHKIIEPVPCGVAAVIKDPLCHALQGQRILVKALAVIAGEPVSESLGDLFFAKYGLSGTSILDISGEISIAINRHHEKDVIVAIDLVPFMNDESLRIEMAKRIKEGRQAEELVAGILPNKFGPALRDLLKTKDAAKIAASLKKRNFKVSGTRGWNEAEFTSGGVDTSQINESTLESMVKKGLYFAGEILDVTGRRGGYNLAWAWASGYVAGLTG